MRSCSTRLAKQTDQAIAGYRKVLAMTPTDERVATILANLGAPVPPEERAAMLRSVIPADIEFLPDIAYGSKTLHILRQPGASMRPALVFIHGGGWTDGSKERGLIPLLHFVRRGFVGVTVGYRLSGEAPFPAQIDDVKAAIRFLREHAAEYGIDPKRIVVWGQSAGGHLAAPARFESVMDAFLDRYSQPPPSAR